MVCFRSRKWRDCKFCWRQKTSHNCYNTYTSIYDDYSFIYWFTWFIGNITICHGWLELANLIYLVLGCHGVVVITPAQKAGYMGSIPVGTPKIFILTCGYVSMCL